MKRIKISLCALFVVLSGILFVACGEKKKDLDVSNISIGVTNFTYDGESHVYKVNYSGTNVDVSYSLNDKSNFKSASQLNLVDAGTYDVYYKISAEGYNDYISESAVEITIVPKDVTVTIGNTSGFKTDLYETNGIVNATWQHSGIVEGDSLDISFKLGRQLDNQGQPNGEEYSYASSVPGNKYEILGVNGENKNYNVTFIDGVFLLKDYVQIENAEGDTLGYYSSLEDAIANAQASDIVVLNKDVELSETLEINKSVKINGNGNKIIATKEFEDLELIKITSGTIDLRNIKLDANQRARVLTANNATITVNNVYFENGYLTVADGDYAPGVKIEDTTLDMFYAVFNNNEMDSGYAFKNINYVQYSSDLLIGKNSIVNFGNASKSGGTVKNVSVEAGDSKLVVRNGNVDTVHLRYDENKSSEFDYIEGSIGRVLIEQKTDTNKCITAEHLQGEKYYGGATVEVRSSADHYSYYKSLEDAVEKASKDSIIYLKENEKVSKTLNVKKSLIIDGDNKYTLTPADNYSSDNMFFMETEGVEFTLLDLTVNAEKKSRVIKVKAGTFNIDGTLITGGKSANFIGGVYITHKASFNMYSGEISGNVNSDEYSADEYAQYSSDLWIGANAKGAMSCMSGGYIGNAFINANEYSEKDQGSFVLNGGNITNVYLEYDKGYGAIMQVVEGNVQYRHIATGAFAGDHKTYAGVAPNSTYVAGMVVLKTATESVGYSNFEQALENAEANSTIILCKDVEVDEEIIVDKNLTIDGQGKHSITAKDTFLGTRVIGLTTNVNLKLLNVTIDANLKARAVYANAGTLTIDGATITRGKTVDSFIGGVYLTSKANFVMTSGNIIGNFVSEDYEDDNYCQYSADLWIGANAVGTYTNITGGTIGNVFVNANEYSATNKGSFTMNGGKIENIYLEYYKEYGGTFVYNDGEIENLYISTTTSGTSLKVEAVKGTTYEGGKEY